MKSPYVYWTLERCKEEALKHKTLTDLQNNSNTAYRTIIKNNWYNECCSHMTGQKPNGYWDNKENCHKEALKYKTRNEFRKNSPTTHKKSIENDWFDYICSHMEKRFVWTKEKCREEAIVCKNRTDFYKKNNSAYSASIKNNWLDEFFPNNKKK